MGGKGGPRGMVMGVLEGGGVGMGPGSGQGLIARGDGFDLHQGTEWWGGV